VTETEKVGVSFVEEHCPQITQITPIRISHEKAQEQRTVYATPSRLLCFLCLFLADSYLWNLRNLRIYQGDAET
jgi:hypothetical protein